MADQIVPDAPVPDCPETPRLTRTEERVIGAMLEHATVTAAAKAVGRHRRNVHRILARPHVLTAYRAARAELIAEASQRLRNAASEAVETLRAVMRTSNHGYSEGARVLAARVVLEMAFSLSREEEFEHIQQDLAELRAKVGGR